jgi:hypothetical protein
MSGAAPIVNCKVPLIACPVSRRPITIHGPVDPITLRADEDGFILDCEHCGGIHEYGASDIFFDPADARRFSSGGRPS